MRRLLSKIALLAGVALVPGSCTMPDVDAGPRSKSPYPQVVEQGGGTPMLHDQESGWDNATRGLGD